MTQNSLGGESVKSPQSLKKKRIRYRIILSAAGIALLSCLGGLIFFATGGRFRVDGIAMNPNLRDGQFLLVNRMYMIRPPQRGEVVVFQFPGRSSLIFIERIIGLPGEKIHVQKGQVFINDQVLIEPQPIIQAQYDWGPLVAGTDEYFVLGDNRANSSDSHSWGMLSREDILGQAWLSYWPPEYWGLVR